MKHIATLLLSALLISCQPDHNGTEKHQPQRNNIIQVKNKVHPVAIEPMGNTTAFLLNEFLILQDYNNTENHIHIYNKNTFEYITSTAPKGKGQGEFVNIGQIAVNEKERKFYVNDYGKHSIFEYNIDSIIANPYYIPKEKTKMSNKIFPLEYDYYHDTLSIALMMKPIGNNDFIQMVSKWNMNNGEMKIMPYEHPSSIKRRITYASSLEDNIYVEGYSRHDLITICDLDGNLKYNIYGPAWQEKVAQTEHYGKIIFIKNYIVALYSGKNPYFLDKNKRTRGSYPEKIHIFNKQGDYIKTLDVGLQITTFRFDKDNNRIFMIFANEYPLQFAYLDLKGIID